MVYVDVVSLLLAFYGVRSTGLLFIDVVSLCLGLYEVTILVQKFKGFCLKSTRITTKLPFREMVDVVSLYFHF